MNEVAIELENVSVRYREYSSASRSLKADLLRRTKRNIAKSKLALDGLHLQVAKGEVLGIIGRNGAGKSTLVRLLMGILHPTTGRVITRGSTVGILQLGAGLNLDLTARENIKFISMLRGLGSINHGQLAEEIADWSGLGEAIDQPLRTYSSGMMARFSFALETSHKPHILIIDEVLAVGDHEFQEKSGSKMKKLIESETTVVLVSHDLDIVQEYCTQAIWIDEGKIRSKGHPSNICREYLTSSSK